jgi:signal transduction histidine kinase
LNQGQQEIGAFDIIRILYSLSSFLFNSSNGQAILWTVVKGVLSAFYCNHLFRNCKIIDSILDYSKLEAEALKIEVNPFPLEDVIADCMELLLPMAVKKLDMSYNIEPDVPRWIVADYARIRQVLMNLLGNGLKFTSEGFVQAICALDNSSECSPGVVTLKVTIRYATVFLTGKSLIHASQRFRHWWVTRNHNTYFVSLFLGLSPADRESLFLPFQQADNSSTRKFGGTGLGLSISRELIKLMNGAIGVESEVNVGSSFWFTIPVEVCNSAEAQKVPNLLDSAEQHLNSHSRKKWRLHTWDPNSGTLKL